MNMNDKTKASMIWLCLLHGYVICSLAIADPENGLIGSIHMIAEQSGTWEKGTKISCNTTTYDNKGNTTQTETAFCDIDGSIVGKKLTSTYRYNDAGKLIKIDSFFDDGALGSTETVHDNGHTRVETVHNPDGSLKDKRTYFYERERKVKETLNDASGSVVFKVIYTYDNNGNLTQTISYKDDKSIDHKNVYAYDKTGNRIEVTTYRSDNSIDNKVTYTYDEKRHKTKSVINKYKMDGSLDEKRVALYNETGYLTETSTYNADGLLQEKETHSYEFDSVGNWIKKTTLKWVIKDGKLSPETPHINKRIITYY
jgi:hypothetical protein